MDIFLMISAKMAILAFLKIKSFWKKSYDAIISVCEPNNETLSHVSNYIVNVVMWSKFGDSSISMREVIITSTL